MNQKKIYGYRKFNSKKGQPFCIVQAGVSYTDKEVERGSCGVNVEEFWIPVDFQDLITPQCIGKNLEVTYTVVGGRAYIDSVAVK